MMLVRAVCVSLVCLVAAAAPAGAAVQLSMAPDHVSTRLGERFVVRTEIVNAGSSSVSGLVVHLNVVGLTRGVYVDPEDWSSARTQYVPTLRPGASAMLRWPIKAVNGGDFAVYVVVLPGRDPATAPPGITVSPAADVHVQEHRTLNSGGVLPLAVGVPGLLGLAALGMRLRRRRV